METDFLDFEFLGCFGIKDELGSWELCWTLVGKSCKQKDCDCCQSGRNAAVVAVEILPQLCQSGRNAAVVAVEILDRNSRFTEKHSS